MILAVALVVFGCGSKSNEIEVGFKTTMSIQTVYDAGNVVRGEMINAKFEVENTGEGPLILSDVKGSCSCTVADWSKDPIPVGEKGFIKAQVNTQDFNYGSITRKITVMSNTTPAATIITVKAKIIK